MAEPQAAPPANPAALGLVAFGLTTVLLSLVNAGILPPGGEGVVIPLALTFGGLMQIVAGAFEFRLNNTFGTTAFLSYGAFWLWFALLLLFNHTHLIDLSTAGPSVGAALILWGVLTFCLWISTFRLSRVVFLVFLTLWVTFGFLGVGAILGLPVVTRVGGLVGLLCGALAMYGSFGLVTNATFGRPFVPLGER
ncbi:MAG TPA: acetate uptake transporter [Phenylobacterium sp.]|nr:acetate uptake transporter [Phenylobacterium sp.]